MTGLWVAGVLMSAVVALAIVMPLIRRPGGPQPSRGEYDITVYKKQVIPKATSVVIYAGRLAARGTAKYSYCSALEGSGEGYVKWGKMRWNSYGPRGTGAQRCDLKAQAKIAAAAKSAMCV